MWEPEILHIKIIFAVLVSRGSWFEKDLYSSLYTVLVERQTLSWEFRMIVRVREGFSHQAA
jgi:hypothetical protein